MSFYSLKSIGKYKNSLLAFFLLSIFFMRFQICSPPFPAGLGGSARLGQPFPFWGWPHTRSLPPRWQVPEGPASPGAEAPRIS